MRIFISHASQQKKDAEGIAERLKSKHTVWQSAVRAGDDIAATIKDQIDKCDLFLFLISPDSVEEGRYPRSELKHASSHSRPYCQ